MILLTGICEKDIFHELCTTKKGFFFQLFVQVNFINVCIAMREEMIIVCECFDCYVIEEMKIFVKISSVMRKRLNDELARVCAYYFMM